MLCFLIPSCKVHHLYGRRGEDHESQYSPTDKGTEAFLTSHETLGKWLRIGPMELHSVKSVGVVSHRDSHFDRIAPEFNVLTPRRAPEQDRRSTREDEQQDEKCLFSFHSLKHNVANHDFGA